MSMETLYVLLRASFDIVNSMIWDVGVRPDLTLARFLAMSGRLQSPYLIRFFGLHFLLRGKQVTYFKALARPSR